MTTLQVIWFCLIGLLLTGYVILDGFDLGIGCWYLRAKKSERKKLLNSIKPYWDGNEVWLLAGGGAVFAAFPHVYATIFSGLYLALMLVLFALIFRAVAIEFRGQSENPTWARAWDAAFFLGSALPALLLGVAAGNILFGMPLDSQMNFTGNFLTLLNPYSLLVGVCGLFMFLTHGALFLWLKTDGELADKAKNWADKSWMVYMLLFIVTALASFEIHHGLLDNYKAHPVLFSFPTLALVAIATIYRMIKEGSRLGAFLSSSAAIVFIFITLGAAIFPNMVPASNDPTLSLTIMNASSSELTLKVMLIIALLGVPLVLAYTTWVHLIFRGKAGEDMQY